MDDIPEALRKTTTSQTRSQPTPGLLMGGILGTGVIVILGGLFLLRPPSQTAQTSPSSVTPVQPTPEPTPVPVSSPSPDLVDNVLGHLEYKQAPASELKAVTTNGQIKLRRHAAEQFLKMQQAAKSQGILLTPISGFRTVSEQNHLFFEIQRQRNQNPSERAEVSAPPNYSEHHTGYAIDIGDGKAPATNLSPNFEKTPAFRWLDDNAAQYSFELSFPRDNPQGISYEPWHWRYVGDQESLETFYKARQLKKSLSN